MHRELRAGARAHGHQLIRRRQGVQDDGKTGIEDALKCQDRDLHQYGSIAINDVN